MSDPVHATSVPAAGPLRTTLWVVLALAVAGNVLASAGVLGPTAHLGLGVLTLLCATALAVLHVRRRRAVTRT